MLLPTLRVIARPQSAHFRKPLNRWTARPFGEVQVSRCKRACTLSKISCPINFCVSLALCFYNLKNKRERQAHLSCTCRSLLGITFFPQNPWIPVHPLSQGMHPRRHFPPSYNRRRRYLRPYGRPRLLFLPCRRFSANHLPPEICLRTCPQCPDIRLRVTLPGNWKSSCLRWNIFKIELNEPL